MPIRCYILIWAVFHHQRTERRRKRRDAARAPAFGRSVPGIFQRIGMVQMNFNIDKSAGAPALYQQIAEQIVEALNEGRLRPGDRLPTENEVLRRTGISRGTVKKAYDSLQQRGIVRKVQGSGVYVQEQLENLRDPKRLVAALFDKLTRAYGMSVPDAYHLVQDLVADAFEDDNPLQVTVVDCNMETIHVIVKQLEQIPGIRLSAVLHDELLLGGDAAIGPQCELALTTQLHHPGVCRYTEPLNLPTEPFALRETQETLAAIAKLPEGQAICVVYRSSAFLSSVRYTLRLAKRRDKVIPCQEEDTARLDQYCLSGLPFLLPPDYLTHSSNRTLQYIYRARAAGSVVIPMAFEIDQGSMLYIAELVKSMRAKRRRQCS